MLFGFPHSISANNSIIKNLPSGRRQALAGMRYGFFLVFRALVVPEHMSSLSFNLPEVPVYRVSAALSNMHIVH